MFLWTEAVIWGINPAQEKRRHTFTDLGFRDMEFTDLGFRDMEFTDLGFRDMEFTNLLLRASDLQDWEERSCTAQSQWVG